MKLNENPDYIGKYDLSFYDDNSLSFGYYKNKMYVNTGLHGENIDIKDLIRFDFKYPGRLWKSNKIISFWKYPSKEELPIILQDIENNSNIIFDDEWKIEVVNNSMGYDESNFVLIDEYYGSPNWQHGSYDIEHVKSPLLKTKKLPIYYKKKICH